MIAAITAWFDRNTTLALAAGVGAGFIVGTLFGGLLF